MQNEFECTKIKDGLYLGTLATTQDYQFLQINKFSYIINCSAQIPNYFDNHGIKYLKFKLIKERTHKLWDENLKKLKKLQKFIQQAEEQSLCCIIFSANGNNRSLVMLTAYLMSKYRWALDKTLAYIRSKSVFIGLSENYILQLETLQKILNSEEDKPKLTHSWTGPYLFQEEEIISKTYINSQEIPLSEGEKKEKKEKRVTWQDKIDKQKKKEVKELKLKQTGIEQFKKVKSNHKFIEETGNPCPSLSTKVLRKELVQSPLKKSQNLKKGKKVKNVSINKIQTQGQLKKQNYQQFSQGEKQEQEKGGQQHKQLKQDNKYFSQKQLIKLIKKNLKLKKQQNPKPLQSTTQDQQNNNEKGVYRLTINNFISPNINIMNSIPDKNSKAKGNKKQDKNTRTQSEKDPTSKNINESLKNKPDKSFKGNKRVTENSPKLREKKLQKAVSLQFKKNN